MWNWSSCCCHIYASYAKFIKSNFINIKTIGGELSVSFENNNDCYNNIWLCGPATLVYSGNFKLCGKKIILRPLNSSDLSFLKHIENNSENWIFGSENKIFSDNELLAYINNSNTNIEDAKQFRWLIEFNNISTGFIDLYDYDQKKKPLWES